MIPFIVVAAVLQGAAIFCAVWGECSASAYINHTEKAWVTTAFWVQVAVVVSFVIAICMA